MTAPDEVQKPSLVVKNPSHKFVFCCPSGRPWDLRSAAWTSCKFYSLFDWILLTFTVTCIWTISTEKCPSTCWWVFFSAFLFILVLTLILTSLDDRGQTFHWTSIYPDYPRVKDGHYDLSRRCGERTGCPRKRTNNIEFPTLRLNISSEYPIAIYFTFESFLSASCKM